MLLLLGFLALSVRKFNGKHANKQKRKETSVVRVRWFGCG